jgi:DNA gyrase/topoisomerase IV subunit A
MIADEDVVVTISNKGFIKRTPVSGYRRQKRGGIGMKGANTKDEEYIEEEYIKEKTSAKSLCKPIDDKYTLKQLATNCICGNNSIVRCLFGRSY